jgi:hypothetical protein
MALTMCEQEPVAPSSLWQYVPETLRELSDPARDLPRIAKDRQLAFQIESAVRDVPTRHDLHLAD